MEVSLTSTPDISENLPEVQDYYHFDRSKKQIFLELFRASPNLTQAAKTVGHSPQVVFWHLERDPEFKKAFEAVKAGLCDQLESRVYEYGQRPQNFMDRIAYLRAYRPERWNPQSQININYSPAQVQSIAAEARQYVDTEAVASPIKEGQKDGTKGQGGATSTP
jgi:hypothetical protein